MSEESSGELVIGSSLAHVADKTIKESFPEEYQGAAFFIKEYANSYKIADELENAPAPVWNFDILIDTSSNSLIVQKKDDGSTEDLTQHMAEGYKLKNTANPDKFGISPKKKVVYVPKEGFSRRGDILNVLHEFAHTHQTGPSVEISTPQQSLEMYKHVIRMGAKLLKSRFLRKADPQEDDITRLSNLQDSLREGLPDWFLADIDKIHAKNERDAWAVALRNAQELEGKGFNVLSGFENKREVLDYVNACLFSYAYDRYERLVKEQGAEGVENFTPHYVRTKTPPKEPFQDT